MRVESRPLIRVRRCRCGCGKWTRAILEPRGWPHVEGITTHRTWREAMFDPASWVTVR